MDERKKRSWPLWTAASLFALPVLYVLSIGPVAKLSNAGIIDDDAMILSVSRSCTSCGTARIGSSGRLPSIWHSGVAVFSADVPLT
jgi:hypothetical protein